MSQTTFYRRASGTAKEATDALFARYPKAHLLSFETKRADATTAKLAKVKKGELIYEATIHLGEFPPEGGEEGGDEAPEPKEEKKPKPEGGGEESDDSDDGGGDAPDFGGDEDGGDVDPFGAPKMKPEEQIAHALDKIVHLLTTLVGGDAGGPPGGGLDVPDIGAPPKGGPGLPPPPHGGPGAGPPPPAAPKAPMGGPAFAHYNPNLAEVVAIRPSDVGNKAIIAEAREVFPTHKVARIQRTGSAILNDGKQKKQVNLAENNIVVVTLTKE